MRKTYKYRIYPTKRQETILVATLENCQWLYNQFLEERKTSWEKHKKSVGLYQQHATVSKLKSLRNGLDTVHSQVLQNVAVRVDLAFKAFFRRVKSGEKPGYPRFKGKGWYDSFTYPQSNGAFGLIENGKFKLSKIGCVKIKYHRKMLGTPKTCTVKRTTTGKWFITVSCDNVKQVKLKKNKNQVGIDVGIKSFATFSDGSQVENPRFFKQEQNNLAKSQRKLSKEVKGTVSRKRVKKVISRVHERIKNKRDNFSHQHSKKIVDNYGFIAFEDLDIKNMLVKGKYPKLSKSIADVSWGDFLSKLYNKAESAGRTVVKINPAYTSQDCSNCGKRQKLKLSDRIFECPDCGLSLDRDLNAAKNILAVGLHSMAQA